MMKRGLILAAATVSLSLALAASLPAALGADEPQLSGNDVVSYKADKSLSNVRRFIVKGENHDDGCSFSTSAKIPVKDRPDHGKIVIHEIAYDPSQCLSLMEQGYSTDTSRSHNTQPGKTLQHRGDSRGEERTSREPTVKRTAPLCESATGICWYIGFHSWFEDPIDIHVNDVTNDISWPADSTTCALPAGTTFGWGALYEWYTTTGWTLEDSNESYPGDCNSVRSSSYAYFLNTVFCPDNNWTRVWYDRNTIVGYPGGTAQGFINWDKNGACNGLLSYNWEYTFE